MYSPGPVKDDMAEAIREFNQFVISDNRVEVVALPFRDGVNIVQRRCGRLQHEGFCDSAGAVAGAGFSRGQPERHCADGCSEAGCD